jgi:murein DD-endopeptidase MepM/ murein hydrolase activator NlpD
MILSLITTSLLATAAVLTPTLAKAEPPGPSIDRRPVETIEAAVPLSSLLHANRTPTESDSGTAPASGPWRAPVGGLDLLTGFDPPPQRWLPGHRGVDLAANTDLPVSAAGSGTVVFADDLAGRGVVSIVHSNGLRTTYEPVDPLVAAGDAVSVGQTIGHLRPGHASCPGAICLHFGLKRGPLYLDPMLLFGSGKVRLLPRPGHAERPAEHYRPERTPAETPPHRIRTAARTPDRTDEDERSDGEVVAGRARGVVGITSDDRTAT